VLYAQRVPTLAEARVDETKASIDGKRVTNLSPGYRNVDDAKAFSYIFVMFGLSVAMHIVVITSISQTVVLLQ
jgi:hypothetical protein